ncbi:MAG: uncharacterized protein KVP18_002491 [Porospora cf. gigantea A]|uniref:uncharacterized protein n=1 Tax=Porospora cf. gigantea A TaxID=2853593 RepID=UPI00355A5D38|nr:MAG: hypothetical protein KVP18_002491 [Porospora cf. gigantea A]
MGVLVRVERPGIPTYPIRVQLKENSLRVPLVVQQILESQPKTIRMLVKKKGELLISVGTIPRVPRIVVKAARMWLNPAHRRPSELTSQALASFFTALQDAQRVASISPFVKASEAFYVYMTSLLTTLYDVQDELVTFGACGLAAFVSRTRRLDIDVDDYMRYRGERLLSLHSTLAAVLMGRGVQSVFEDCFKSEVPELTRARFWMWAAHAGEFCVLTDQVFTRTAQQLSRFMAPQACLVEDGDETISRREM